MCLQRCFHLTPVFLPSPDKRRANFCTHLSDTFVQSMKVLSREERKTKVRIAVFPAVACSSTAKQGVNTRHVLRRRRAISAGSYSVSLQLQSLALPSRFAQTSHLHYQTYISRLAFQHPSEAKLATVPEQPKAAAGSLESASVCRTCGPV